MTASRASRVIIVVIVALAALFAGFLAGRATAPARPSGAASGAAAAMAASPAALIPATLPFAAVPDVRQSTGYTCGAAALQAVLAYWGIDEREDRLAARLRTTPEAGTHPDAIIRGARELGLTADLREGLEMADLERALADGRSVIVDLQAWRDSPDAPWTETWDDGHYMVLLGMDAANLYFEDPSLLGARGVIPRAEFVDRWHDYEGEPPLDPSDRRYVHMAIFLKGRYPAPARPAAFEPVR
ncbi:MAG: C39 family peptidase [Acidobacteriota bacterium]